MPSREPRAAPEPAAGSRPGRRGTAARRSSPCGESESDARSGRSAIRRRVGNPGQVEAGGGARRHDPVAYLGASRLQPPGIESGEEIEVLFPECFDDGAVELFLDDEMAQTPGGEQADAL